MKTQNILAILVVILAFPLYRIVIVSKQSPLFFIPNLLLFTGFRDTARVLWHNLLKFDTDKIFTPEHIPVLSVKNYSWAAFKTATDNFRNPIVVRGMFADTPAVKKWGTKDYLANSAVGKHSIPIVRRAVYGHPQGDRFINTFANVTREIFSDENSYLYAFFPVKSQFHFNGSDTGSREALQEDVNELVHKDLELERILWKGFGTKSHKTFRGSQLIIGRGHKSLEQTTGTGWHCAMGSNYFVQVVGRKRWYFLDPKHSAFMFPLRGGLANMMTGNKNMTLFHKYLPLRYVDLEAGDMLYNPDWQWHSIQNYEGLSIGVPVREANFSYSFTNNLQYSSIVSLNLILEKFGLSVGGYMIQKFEDSFRD